MNQSLPKNMKSVFLLFNTDMFTDEGSSPSAVTEFPLQEKEI